MTPPPPGPPSSPPPSSPPPIPPGGAGTAGRAAQVIEQLRSRYQISSAAIVASIREHAAALGSAPAAPPTLTALEQLAHRVHGTAGSYGLTRASELAAAFEVRVAGWARDPALETGERHILAREFAGALEVALRGG